MGSPVIEDLAEGVPGLAQFDKEHSLGSAGHAIVWSIVFLFAERNFRLCVNRNFDTIFDPVLPEPNRIFDLLNLSIITMDHSHYLTAVSVRKSIKMADKFVKMCFLLQKINGDRRSTSTVLSGAEERGVDGPSQHRSYFSRLQPISFLFFNPSSSHVGQLAERTRYRRQRRMLDGECG